MKPGIDWPLDENFIRRGLVNHTYGPVRRNRDGSPRNHQGWDFYAEPGTPCYAVADGVVARVYTSPSYGRCVILRIKGDANSDGKAEPLFILYAHLSEAHVKLGDTVQRGDRIGLTGNTGNAVSMRGKDQHLHLEVRTRLDVGRGLDGRMSPLRIFGKPPMREMVKRMGA